VTRVSPRRRVPQAPFAAWGPRIDSIRQQFQSCFTSPRHSNHCQFWFPPLITAWCITAPQVLQFLLVSKFLDRYYLLTSVFSKILIKLQAAVPVLFFLPPTFQSLPILVSTTHHCLVYKCFTGSAVSLGIKVFGQISFVDFSLQ
jgi:hypothetical protein